MLLALPAPGPEEGLSVSKRAYPGPGAGGAYRAGYGSREGTSGDGSQAGLETVRRVLALHQVPPEIGDVSRNISRLPK